MLREVKIAYPGAARRAGVSGVVRMRILVDETGHVTQVRILSGPGHGLNEAARDAIGGFEFAAARKDGAPVAAMMIYNYRFILDR